MTGAEAIYIQGTSDYLNQCFLIFSSFDILYLIANYSTF